MCSLLNWNWFKSLLTSFLAYFIPSFIVKASYMWRPLYECMMGFVLVPGLCETPLNKATIIKTFTLQSMSILTHKRTHTHTQTRPEICSYYLSFYLSMYTFLYTIDVICCRICSERKYQRRKKIIKEKNISVDLCRPCEIRCYLPDLWRSAKITRTLSTDAHLLPCLERLNGVTFVE